MKVAPTDPSNPDIVDVDEKLALDASSTVMCQIEKKKSKVGSIWTLIETDYCEQEPQVSIVLQKIETLSSDCRFRQT